MDEKVGPVLQHCRVGAHAATRFIDAPALPRSIAGPQETDRAAIGRSSAETAHLRFANNGRRGEVLKTHAIEDFLRSREVLDQKLGSEVALLQSVDKSGSADIFEVISGSDFKQHA